MSEQKRKPGGRPFEKGHTRGGAPIGNQNAKKFGMWKRAIMRALEKRGHGDAERALDELAAELLSAVAAGDIHAIRELGDRLDGKPAQAIDLTNSDGSLSQQWQAALKEIDDGEQAEASVQH